MQAWLADKLEHWPIERLLPYIRNARTHSEAQIAQIAASIAEFGFTAPILAGSDGVIVAGHGRLAAARKLGLASVPVVVLEHLTPTQRRALVIADNRIAENAGWDEAMLQVELAALQDDQFDLALTGFDADALADLLAGEETTTQGDTDLLGMGVSAISMIGDCYAQNQKELKQYYQQVDETGTALWRGIALTRDDCIRRDVIKALICNFRLGFSDVEAQWDLQFSDYFAEDLKLLAPLAKDGLVDVDEKGIQVTPKGRLLIRNICMCFDAYLRQKARLQQFSRVI